MKKEGNKYNQRILSIVDEAISQYGAEAVCVYIGEWDDCISVKLFAPLWFETYCNDVCKWDDCNIDDLEQELCKRKVNCNWKEYKHPADTVYYYLEDTELRGVVV